MLNIDHLTFGYPRQSTPVISNLNLTINADGIYGLLGPNGAGKSTLLYLISGLLTPKHGSVMLFGKETRLRLPNTLNQIFLVPEEFTLPPIKLSEYIDIYSRYYPRFSYDDMQRNLATFDVDPKCNLATLSMGQKKKAYMCFALSANTPLLLMDEPTNGLDIPSKASFRQFIASAMTEEKAVIISTHQVRDIDQLLDHIIIMNKNTVLLNQSITEIAKKLSFRITNNPAEAMAALYALPDIVGTHTITINNGNEETTVNLETLFQFAITKPEIATQLFADPTLPPKCNI